jgi:hypothetical protein
MARVRSGKRAGKLMRSQVLSRPVSAPPDDEPIAGDGESEADEAADAEDAAMAALAPVIAIGTFNCRSLNPASLEFIVSATASLDVVCLSEIHAPAPNAVESIRKAGFEYLEARRSGRTGGGVALLVRRTAFSLRCRRCLRWLSAWLQ